MRKFLFLFLMLVPVMSLAEPTPATPAPTPAVATPSKAAPASALDIDKDKRVDAAETAAATNADAGVTDVIRDGADVVSAVKGFKDPTLPKGLAVAVILGAIFKLLLSLLKMVSKFTPWFKSQDGKRVLKYSTLGLGAAAALCANLVFGMSWIDAVTILLSGPLAVAIHEYTSDSKPVPAAPKA